MAEQDDLYVGRKALEEGLVRPEQLLECLYDLADERRSRRTPRPLGVLLLQRGFLRQPDLNRILAGRLPASESTVLSFEDLELGKLVVALGYATREQVQEALKIQQAPGPPRRLGEILVERQVLTPAQVQRLLAYHDKAIYACAACGTRFNVLGAKPDASYACKKCGGTLEPAGPDATAVANTAFGLKAITSAPPPRPPAATPAPPAQGTPEARELDRATAVYIRQKVKIRREALREAEEFQEEAERYGLHVPILELLQKKQALTWQQAEQIRRMDFRKILSSEAWKKQAVPGYVVTGKLAAGGFATVFTAEPVFGGAKVVLKLMHASKAKDAVAVKRFRQEAALLAKLGHPHIVKAFDFGEFKGIQYMTLELVEGQSLDRRVQEKGPLSPPEAIAVARQVAQALHYLQQEGFIHRDMKPENILVDGAGVAKVCDFGFAAEIREKAVGQSEVTLGTVGYVSPEQARGELNLKVGTDIYSLGLTLYFTLTGKEPFKGMSSDTIMAERFGGGAVATPDFGALESLPAPLVALVKRMLHPDRAQRYRTYAELLAALEAAEANVR